MPPIPWVDLGDCEEKKKSTFSEYGHVAYQIKGNEVYNNIQANILPFPKPSTTGVRVKDQNI